MKAMILAAGRGERMRPLTDQTPKPLLEVGGQPLIAWHLHKLKAIGVQEVVINTAWLPEKLVSALGQGEQFKLQIHWSHEVPGGLETAGGIVQALPLLGSEPFVVVNGDIWTDYSLQNLPQEIPEQGGHLVLVNNPEHNTTGDFALNADGWLVEGKPKYTFSGISVLCPRLFTGLAPGKRPLRPIFEAAIKAKRMRGELFGGAWTDVGTPERLLRLNEALQMKQIEQEKP